MTKRHPAPHPHRSSAPRLDPYSVQGTLTLEEWRRSVAPVPAVHIVRYQESDKDPLAA